MSRWLPMLALVLTIVSPVRSEPCPELISAECGEGSSWFGMRFDGANIAQGQTVLLPCEATVTSAEFYLMNRGVPNGSVPPMVAGDPIYVTVMDEDRNHLGTATANVPWDVGEGWITFVFDEVTLSPGLYLFGAYTDVPRQMDFRFCLTGDAPYPDGMRYVSVNGLAGPWGPANGNEVPFRVHLVTVPSATEASTWGTVKGLYR